MLTILQGDVIEQLRTLPDESVHCCVTSPPYWGLRDYGTAEWEGGEDDCDHIERTAAECHSSSTLGPKRDGLKPNNAAFKSLERQFLTDCGKCGAKRIDSQLGLEKTPEEYVAKMVEVFREVRRVLRKDGTLWLNLGDSYASDFKGSGGPSEKQLSNAGSRFNGSRLEHGLKPKDMCGIPWRVAFALQADGWWLRSDIIWAKPNPMPESVTDRPTKAHEYLFLLTKSANYFYDAEAIKEAAEYGRREWSNTAGNLAGVGINGKRGHATVSGSNPESGRNKRSVWTVATAPYPEAHFATYPPDLIKPCILAGTSAKGCCAKCGSPWERIVERPSAPAEVFTNRNAPKDEMVNAGYRINGEMVGGGGKLQKWRDKNPSKTIGWRPTCKCWNEDHGVFSDGFPFRLKPCTVLDPFAGSGTTGAVALELGRKAILIELNPKYVELIRQRCNITPGLQLA